MKINKINNYKAIIMELLKSLNKALIKNSTINNEERINKLYDELGFYITRLNWAEKDTTEKRQ